MAKRMELCFLFLVICSLASPSEATLWTWFALGPSAAAGAQPNRQQCSSRPTDLAKFDIETGSFLSNSRGKDLVEKARHQTAKHSCWHAAYAGLLSSCREILKEEETKARLAMRLTNCFLKVSERDAIDCPDSVPISKCTSSLSDHTNSIFLAFFIDAASMCHHLQSEAFKKETEHVINELKGNAHWLESQLRTMESQTSAISEQNELLITEQKVMQTKMQEHSNELVSEYHRLHAEMRERVKDGFSGLSSATKEVHEQLRSVESLQDEMADKQKEMLDQQKDMSDHQHRLANSLAMEFANLQDKTQEIAHSMSEEFSSLHEKSFVIADSLGSLEEKSHIIAISLAKEFSTLQEKSTEIAQSLTTEFSSLHDVTHEIDNGVQRSLTGQKALLDEQAQAKEGLHNLKQLQESAFEENRASVLAFTQEAKLNQQEFLAWQTRLQSMHDQLTRGSNAMLEAQESFVSKQSAVFASLERLFSLHNAILLESRALKTFLFYVAASIFVYMSTSAKQTCSARPLLYCGLLLTFAVELWILRSQTLATRGLHQSILLLVFPRLTYGVSTVIILFFYVLNYRDYATLSYELLVDIQERLKGLSSKSPKLAAEETSQHSLATLSKINRCSSVSYDRILSKKIVRRAQRACRSNPITWLFPSWTSNNVSGEESCLDRSLDAQAQGDDGFQDPDYMPTVDVVSPLTPSHSYNLRPRRRSRMCSDNISSLRLAYLEAASKTG